MNQAFPGLKLASAQNSVGNLRQVIPFQQSYYREIIKIYTVVVRIITGTKTLQWCGHPVSKDGTSPSDG